MVEKKKIILYTVIKRNSSNTLYSLDAVFYPSGKICVGIDARRLFIKGDMPSYELEWYYDKKEFFKRYKIIPKKTYYFIRPKERRSV